MTMSFWDEQFSCEGYRYGTEPNAFVKDEARRITHAGAVLVPADGEGRNSVWLAEQGFMVTAVDGSKVGLAKGQALAKDRGVSVTPVCADLTSWEAGEGLYDGVVLTFLHLPEELRRPIHRRLAKALKPEGLLILEVFHPTQLGRPSGGPKESERLCTLDDLRADFEGLLEEESSDDRIETDLDEGPGHRGPAVVIRYIGRRA